MPPVATKLYPDGPTRLFSTERFLGAVPYSGGFLKGYVGAFVCGQCRIEVVRVLYSMLAGAWLCRDCETAWRRAESGLKAMEVPR